MEADKRGRARHRDDGRHEILRALDPWRVDDDVRRTELFEDPQRLCAVLVVEPARVPELDEHLVVAELLVRPLQIVERAILVHDIRGKLKEDPAQLAGRPEWLERCEEAAEDLSAKLAGGPVDATLLVGRHLVAEVRRQRLQLHRVSRHQSERLHVHDKVVRRPLGPALDHRLVWKPVVGGVDLDRVEVLRVVAEPVACLQPGRIPVLRECLVGPRTRADPDLSHEASIRDGARTGAPSRCRLFARA